MRLRGIIIWIWLLVLVLPGPVMCAAPAVQVVKVKPSRVGDLVVCNLKTRGLPAEKQLQSMRSGLVSSVELDLALFDENDHFLAGNSLTLRLAFDLWEEIFSVQDDGNRQEFKSLTDLEDYLADLIHLPVASANSLESGIPMRLKIDLTVHSIAPDERERVGDVIAGDQRSQREGLDRQEASVSLGRLIRFFYKDDGPADSEKSMQSRWFKVGELIHE